MFHVGHLWFVDKSNYLGSRWLCRGQKVVGSNRASTTNTYNYGNSIPREEITVSKFQNNVVYHISSLTI